MPRNAAFKFFGHIEIHTDLGFRRLDEEAKKRFHVLPLW